MDRSSPSAVGPSPGSAEWLARGLRTVLSGGVLVLVALAPLTPVPGAVSLHAQSRGAEPGPQDDPPADGEESLTVRTLMERTIFGIDVLDLTVRFDGRVAERLRTAAEGGAADSPAADSVARLAAEATRAVAHLDFVRDVSLDAFLGGIRTNALRAAEAGMIERNTYDEIAGSLRAWYAFLSGRGVEEGDRMSYHIRGDTLNVRYRSADGELLLDRTDVGPEHRRSVLAGYFAPGSDFREGLLRSLFGEAERR